MFQKGNSPHHWTQNSILRATETGEYGAFMGFSMGIHGNTAVVNAPGAVTGFPDTREGMSFYPT